MFTEKKIITGAIDLRTPPKPKGDNFEHLKCMTINPDTKSPKFSLAGVPPFALMLPKLPFIEC